MLLALFWDATHASYQLRNIATLFEAGELRGSSPRYVPVTIQSRRSIVTP